MATQVPGADWIGHGSLPSSLLCVPDQGKNNQAMSLYEQSLAVMEKAVGPQHPQVAEFLDNQALWLESQVKTDSRGTSDPVANGIKSIAVCSISFDRLPSSHMLIFLTSGGCTQGMQWLLTL